MRSPSPVRRAVVGAVAVLLALLGGCMGMGERSTSASAAAEPIDVRKFLGPDYCPELRVREGTEVLRRYQSGNEDDPAYVIWQASIGETARECLYDGQGNLTVRIGISGRVIAGPRGGPGPVSAPLRIAVVKYQEAVLSSNVYPLAIAIPAAGSMVFTEVKEITVPSPGADRDYIIYVGFDDGQEVPIGNVTVRRPEAAEQPAEVLSGPEDLLGEQ